MTNDIPPHRKDELRLLNYQTATNIALLGSLGIIIATFLTGKQFLTNLSFYKNPITYFFGGGLCLVLAGFLAFFYYRCYNWEHRRIAFDLCQLVLFLGIIAMIVSSLWTLYLFFSIQQLS